MKQTILLQMFGREKFSRGNDAIKKVSDPNIVSLAHRLRHEGNERFKRLYSDLPTLISNITIWKVLEEPKCSAGSGTGWDEEWAVLVEGVLYAYLNTVIPDYPVMGDVNLGKWGYYCRSTGICFCIHPTVNGVSKSVEEVSADNLADLDSRKHGSTQMVNNPTSTDFCTTAAESAVENILRGANKD